MCKTAKKRACEYVISPEMSTFLEIPEEVVLCVLWWIGLYLQLSVLSLRGASGEKALLCDYTAPPVTAKPVTRC